ncbi:hypothetical protein R3P38DRAFT_2921026 [Favolaschia claudopus]|uniref:Uncharacterized protein n=1 Tax=Favolaschia claudopus TaxID=2862362 RepID=A0AAW0C3K7_9AGAR
MFLKLQAIVFALSLLSVSLGRPFESDFHPRRLRKPALVRAQVIRAQVQPRDAPTTCTNQCGTLTVKVSGTATVNAPFTVTFGSAATPTVPPVSALGNFGSCSIPEIEFGTGFDGHVGTSFRPVDQASYKTGSAHDISVITGFICDALINTCGADPTAQATCVKAQTASAAQLPQEGIDADVFNGLFGIQTFFKDVTPISDSTGAPVSANVSAPAGASTSVKLTSFLSTAAVYAPLSLSTPVPSSPSSSHGSATHDAATHTTHTTESTSSTTSTTSSTTSSPASSPSPPVKSSQTSNNLQTFTSALGGIPAPAVVASGKQFQVEGNKSLFNDQVDALSRSCADQQNSCSNAANAGRDQGGLTVAACRQQQIDCDTVNGVTGNN